MLASTATTVSGFVQYEAEVLVCCAKFIKDFICVCSVPACSGGHLLRVRRSSPHPCSGFAGLLLLVRTDMTLPGIHLLVVFEMN